MQNALRKAQTVLPHKPKVLFFGTAAYAIPALQWLHQQGYGPDLVVTQPDKPIGRKQTLTSPVIKAAAERLNIPVFQPSSFKDPAIEKELRSTAWTIGLVAAYGKILPSWLVNLPERGLLNLHPSLLPRYRGASPIQTTIANGDLESGNTLMLLDDGMDTGPIIGQQSLPVSLRETTATLEKKVTDALPALLDQYFKPYLMGTIQPMPQPESSDGGTHLLTREDGKINWQDAAERIDRLYRAYHPWPGVWTVWNGSILKLLSIQKKNTPKLAPGQVSWANQTLSIGCNSGVITVAELQLEGKKPLSAAAFMNGYPTFADAHLV